MKNILLIGTFLFLFISTQAQTVTCSLFSGPNSFISVDFSANIAGHGWNTFNYDTSGWQTPYNGSGAQNGSIQCAGPNQSAYGYVGVDTMIWSSPTTLAPDTACFRGILTLPKCGRAISATIQLAADDYEVIYINGDSLGTDYPNGGATYTLDSSQCSIFRGGLNLVAGQAVNVHPSCGYFDIIMYVTVDTSGCAAISAGINNINTDVISVYPIPATNQINITVADNESYQAAMYDEIGNLVLTQNITEKNTTISIESISKGVYTLQLTDKNGEVTNKRVVKE